MDCPYQANCAVCENGETIPYHQFYQVSELYSLAYEILETYQCSECSRIKKIVHWVHKHIPYRTDQSNFGMPDYWQFPTEALENGSGDCDCLSFLVASMLEAVGIPTRVEMGNSPMGYHMWVCAVDLDNDEAWVLIETTNGKIYPYEHRSDMHYYPDIYINPVGCSPPEDLITTDIY